MDLEKSKSGLRVQEVLQVPGVSASMAKRVEEADQDGDGTISCQELVNIVSSENSLVKVNQSLKKVTIVLSVLLVVTMAVTVGLTAAVGETFDKLL
jgi:hypothetical protein